LVHVAIIAILITTVAGGPASAGTTTPPPPPFPWRLVFTHQPANAQVNDFITSVAYTPSGAPVQVSVIAANNSVVTSFFGTITLSFKSNPGNGVLKGTLTRDVVNGRAEFPDISIDQSGSGYRLHATACPGCSTGGFMRREVSVSPADSGRFDIADVVKTCDAGPCSSGDVTQGNTTAHMETSSGQSGDKLVFSVSDGFLNCAHYKETSELVEFSVTGSRSKVVTLIIPRTPTRALSTYQVCYNSTNKFTDRSGQLVKTGLLPDCSAVADVPPCVVSRAFDGSNVVITFSAPVGDPHGRT
jgi:hypothetical protein